MNLSILARQTIAAIGGILAHHGVVADTHSTASIIGGIIVVIISLLWSLIEKADMDDSTQDAVKKVAGALASQIVAALAGWLQADAATAADPAALLLFMGNATLSHVRGHVPVSKLLLFAASAFLCGCYLTSCSNLAQDALKKRAEEAALEVGKQATVVGVEGTLNWLRRELKALEAKPVDEDPYQQLIDQNRISALKAAIKSGEEQLVKLRAQQVNPSAQIKATLVAAHSAPTSPPSSKEHAPPESQKSQPQSPRE